MGRIGVFRAGVGWRWLGEFGAVRDWRRRQGVEDSCSAVGRLRLGARSHWFDDRRGPFVFRLCAPTALCRRNFSLNFAQDGLFIV